MKNQLVSISAQGMKGLSFEEALGKHNLFIGPNGSGKSARAAAVNLLLMGYVPGIGKQPGVIMDELCPTDKLFVSGKISNGTTLLRRLAKTQSGASVDTLINYKKANKDKFSEAIKTAPMVFDLSAFMALSDSKKMEYLLELFPGSKELAAIDTQLSKLMDKLNRDRQELRDKERLAANLAGAHSQIKLPSGTLAEIQQEIQRTTAEYKLTRDNIERERKAQAEREAAEKATKAAEAAAKRSAEAIAQQPVPQQAPAPPKTVAAPGKCECAPQWGNFPYPEQPSPAPLKIIDPPPVIMNPIISIQRIIDAMDKVCPTCAAKLVAKMELNRQQQQESEMKF